MNDKLAIFEPNRADPHEDEIKELREENKKLARALQDANTRADRAREDADRALSALRRQLTPLYRALQGVFGELDAAGVSEAGDTTPESSSGRSVREMTLWADWKTKLPSTCSRVIDVLLLHNDLSVKQIMANAKMGEATVYAATSKMGRLGLIEKSGGRFSLKQL